MSRSSYRIDPVVQFVFFVASCFLCVRFGASRILSSQYQKGVFPQRIEGGSSVHAYLPLKARLHRQSPKIVSTRTASEDFPEMPIRRDRRLCISAHATDNALREQETKPQYSALDAICRRITLLCTALPPIWKWRAHS